MTTVILVNSKWREGLDIQVYSGIWIPADHPSNDYLGTRFLQANAEWVISMPTNVPITYRRTAIPGNRNSGWSAWHPVYTHKGETKTEAIW